MFLMFLGLNLGQGLMFWINGFNVFNVSGLMFLMFLMFWINVFNVFWACVGA